MTKFTIDIADTSGIAGACARYNADNAETEGFKPLDEAGYVSFVMNSAADSWAKQYAPAKVFTEDAKLVGKTFTDDSGKPVEVALAEPKPVVLAVAEPE